MTEIFRLSSKNELMRLHLPMKLLPFARFGGVWKESKDLR